MYNIDTIFILGDRLKRLLLRWEKSALLLPVPGFSWAEPR
jgi:hypothetical protein